MADEKWFDVIAKGATSYLKAKTAQKKAELDMQSKLAMKAIESKQNYLYKIAEKEHQTPYEKMMAQQYQGQQQGGTTQPQNSFAPTMQQRSRIEPGAKGFTTKTIGLKEAIYNNIMKKPEDQRTAKENKFMENYLFGKGQRRDIPTSVDKILGALATGGPVDKGTGIKINDFETRDEAETYAMYNLGPDWKTRYSRALEIINQQFPQEKITSENTQSPYPEYPDAFQEDGVWKVIQNGKKYRIED